MTLNFDSSYLFDTGFGAGANKELDDMIDDAGIINNDGRSNTRTTFLAGEASYDSERRYNQYKRLAKVNDGMWDSNRAADNFKADMRRITKTFCSQVELNSRQQERVQWVMDDMDINSFGSYSTEKVLLGVMSLVANEDRRLLRDEDSFRGLVVSVEMTMDEVKRVRQLIRDRTDTFDS